MFLHQPFLQIGHYISKNVLKSQERRENMKKSDADRIISSYIKKIFAFSMSRMSDSYRAEELASEITLQVYSSLLRQDGIENMDGYVYRIARNVYARYIDSSGILNRVDGIDSLPDGKDFTLEIVNLETVGILRREITYLSQLRRKIVVLHYFEGKKIKEIASELSIPENTVKWHLACSRKELRIGMDRIRTTGSLGAAPIHLINLSHSGTAGEKGDTSDFLGKTITQNVAYAAYHKPATVNEIADELGINPIFVKDEVNVLEEYGFMDKLKNGKYRTNVMIFIPNEESREIYRKINPQYAQLFAEKYYAPFLEKVTDIPDFVHVPGDDINLLKWSMISFLANRLVPEDCDFQKFSVKRPDGGDYIAYAQLEVKPDLDTGGDENIYGYCGDMWRGGGSEGAMWSAWQLDTHWTDRKGGWRENMSADFDKLYFFLKGKLPPDESNAESYARLLEKGYIVKNGDTYSSNCITCDSQERWQSLFPKPGEEIRQLCEDYSKLCEKAELIGQPEHMHQQIKYEQKKAPIALHTRVMKILLDMGVLKPPADTAQEKSLLTILFTGK